jgi:hypothetical protein
LRPVKLVSIHEMSLSPMVAGMTSGAAVAAIIASTLVSSAIHATRSGRLSDRPLAGVDQIGVHRSSSGYGRRHHAVSGVERDVDALGTTSATSVGKPMPRFT